MVHLNPNDRDLRALALTIGYARTLTDTDAGTAEWDALTRALEESHTTEQLARMLTGATAIIARVIGAVAPATKDET